MTYYTETNRQCEYCECDLHISTEVIKTDDGLFCSDECTNNHYAEMHSKKTVTLTDDELYKDVD